MIAPIVLFVYNRPWHTAQTLEALAKNDLANESTLYIYADGAKTNASDEVLSKIEETRALIKSKKWCKEVNIIESDTNKGLANSIIHGVTEVVNKHGNVIVLEDDIVPAVGFLKYMNDALKLYETEDKVGCIHAWNYVLDTKKWPHSTFFLKGADCWGWGTWKRSWELFEPNGEKLLNEILEKKSNYNFNRKGTHDFVSMLKDQIVGNNNSWAVRWHASLFIQGKYCLHPKVAIVENIGLDGSGVHCNEETSFLQQKLDTINVSKIDIKESNWFFDEYYFYLNKSKKSNKWSLLKRYLRKYYHQFF